jgi:ribosome-binding protein aMBF1 (putative translation factor)
VNPEQCVEARKLIGWSRGDLTEAAEIPVKIVEMFEAHDLHGLAIC